MLLQNSHQFGQHAKITAKSLQSQFGQKCDIKKAGNSYASASLTTPGLRSVTTVRTSFVEKPPHCAFPALPSLRPGGADVGLASLAFRVGTAGRHPATGLSHAATSLSPSFSDLSRMAASSRNSRDALRVRRLFASLTKNQCLGGFVPQKMADFLSANKKGHLAVAC
ncbi:hypothetical protein [Allorhodopirellula solitaria]|nr:hypothetical protein [Allorhodopirellula solitaria]